jgi:hypothetical protein
LEGGTGAAFFSDTLTASSTSVTDTSAGFVRYLFQLDASLSTPGPVVPFHPGIAGVRLELQHNGVPANYEIASLDSTRGQAGNLGSSDTLTSSYVSGIGSISGSGIFSSTLHGQFQDFDHEIKWNQPFDVKVALMAGIDGTADATAKATLIGVELFDANHNRVSDFSIASTSGTSYVSPIPEPMPFWMMIIGLLLLGTCFRSTHCGSGKPCHFSLWVP